MVLPSGFPLQFNNRILLAGIYKMTDSMKLTKLLTFLLFIPFLAGAQFSSSVQISVSATVVSESPVEIITISNMVIDAEEIIENEIYISPINSPNAGLFQIIGLANSQIRINYNKNVTILSEDNTGSVRVNYELSYYPERIQTASYAFSNDEQVMQFDETGIFYIWVGGNINLNNAVSGSYSGQFSIEIEYI
jgi:hypothetical protein